MTLLALSGVSLVSDDDEVGGSWDYWMVGVFGSLDGWLVDWSAKVFGICDDDYQSETCLGSKKLHWKSR